MRWIRWGLYGVGGVVVAWTALWHAVEPIAENRAAAVFEKLEKRGLLVAYRDLDISGFPLRFDVHVEGLTVERPESALSLSAPSVTAAMSLLSPMTAVITTDQPMRAARGRDAARQEAEITPENFTLRLERVDSGAYVARASADKAFVALTEPARERTLDAMVEAPSFEARFDRDHSAGEAMFRAATARVEDIRPMEARAIRLTVESIDGALNVNPASVRLEGAIDTLRLDDKRDGDAPEPLATAAIAAPAPASPAAEAPSGGFREALRELVAKTTRELFDHDGAVEATATVNRIDVQRTLPKTAAPMAKVAFGADDSALRLRIGEHDGVLEATTGPLAYRSDSVNGVVAEGAAASMTMRSETPLDPGPEPQTATLDMRLADLTLSEETLALLYPEGEPTLAPGQGLLVTAEASVDVAHHPLTSLEPGPPLQLRDAKLRTMEAALLDFAMTASGEMQREDDSRHAMMDVELARFRPFLKRFQKLDLFEPALVNIVGMTVGAFAKPSDDPDVSTIRVELRDEAMFLNGRKISR